MSCGKRTFSFSSSAGAAGGANRLTSASNAAAAATAAKKKKKYSRVATFVPPTKFLLGGNIRDPLNLNGLQQEDEGGEERRNRDDVVVRPPLDDFLLGGNINDPLNLKGIAEQEVAAVEESVDAEPPADVAPEEPDEEQPAEEAPETATDAHPADGCVLPNGGARTGSLNLNVSAARKLERKDKIVSPVVPQPYRPLKAVPFRQIITPDLGTKALKTPKFREKNARFQYGNYQRYYSYRNAQTGADQRLEILERHAELFRDKDVLDVGCNVGHVALAVARGFGAKSVTGVDIDRYLVDVARRNVRYYVNCASPYPSSAWQSPAQPADAAARNMGLKYKCYPVSMPILYGPICDTDMAQESRKTFPQNVRFVHGNYVLESEEQLQAEQPQYDTILCLSVTKWIHLNWGDGGLRLAFKRMFAQLKPGGVLILEPQSWDSYKRKKSLTETIWRNYRGIQLFPHHFDRYLLSSEVGFSRCQTLAVVNHQHKGFRRAIKVFKKPIPSVHSLSTPPESLVERFVNLHPCIKEEG